MLLSKAYLDASKPRIVDVKIIYLSDSKPEDLDEIRKSKNADALQKRGRKTLEKLSASTLMAIKEMSEISSRLRENDKHAEIELSVKLGLIKEMLQEVLGKDFTQVQSFTTQIEDIAIFDEGHEEWLDHRIKELRHSEQIGTLDQLANQNSLSPNQIFSFFVNKVLDEETQSDKAIKLNFLSAVAYGISPSQIIEKIKMERTKAYLQHWAGLDLPMLQATITHKTAISFDDIHQIAGGPSLN